MIWFIGSMRGNLASPEGGVSPSPCASFFFSLYQRTSSPKKLAVWPLWHWAEYEGRIAATFPPCPVSRKEPIGSLLFSHGGWNRSRAESAGCLALHCLVTSHTPKAKSKRLLKGFGTELISKDGNMKSLSRGTQPWDGSHIPSAALPLGGTSVFSTYFRLLPYPWAASLTAPWPSAPLGLKGAQPPAHGGAPSPQDSIRGDRAAHSAKQDTSLCNLSSTRQLPQ